MALPGCKTNERNRNASQRPALVLRLQPFDQMCFLFTMSDTKASRLRLRSPSADFGDMLLKPAFRLQTDMIASDFLFGRVTPSLACPAYLSWWSQTGSNRRPHACKARALPTELWPLEELAVGIGQSAVAQQSTDCRLSKPDCRDLVGLGGLEPPTSRLSSARSNQLSYKPVISERKVREQATEHHLP